MAAERTQTAPAQAAPAQAPGSDVPPSGPPTLPEITPGGPGSDERKLVTGAGAAVAAIGLPAGIIAYLAVGWSGVASAAVGLSFVWVLFGGSALLLARAARQRDDGIATLAAGALIRLPLYLVTLSLLNQLSWVHGRSLALATAAAVAVTLAYELWLIARSPRMFWIDPEAVRPSAVSNATRS